MASTEEDYDKLSPAEREAKDKAAREREEKEQAGSRVSFFLCHFSFRRRYIVGLILSSTSIDLALPYTWKQQLGDVDIEVPVPKGTRARDLTVVLQKKKLSVGFKGKEPIMGGELCKDIKVEDSTWTIRASARSS